MQLKMYNLEVVLLLVIVGLINGMDSRALKRSETKSENNVEKAEEYPTKVNYDVYPLVFPKRAAMLLDRLMVALHHALEDDDQTEIKKINDMYRNGQFASQYKAQVAPKVLKGKTDSEAQSYYGYKLISNGQTDELDDIETKSMELGLRGGDGDQDVGQADENMDLQRRGHNAGLGPNKGRVYWRCYFNAVTCF